MPFAIYPYRRFPVPCAVPDNAGPFQGQDTVWNLSCAYRYAYQFIGMKELER